MLDLFRKAHFYFAALKGILTYVIFVCGRPLYQGSFVVKLYFYLPVFPNLRHGPSLWSDLNTCVSSVSENRMQCALQFVESTNMIL